MKKFPVLLLMLLIPVLGFAQEAADTAPKFVRTWIMTEDFTVMEDYRMDTAQTGFQISYPVFRSSISQAFLGNNGLQTRNNLYFNRDPQTEYFFLRPFVSYLYTPENTVFYNITKPFTLLEYFAATGDRLKREETFHVIHTQNITPFLNLGFDVRLLGSEGSYLRQKSKFNSVRLFGSYTGNDYSAHSSFNLNTQTAQENGGLKNDSIFMNSLKDERAYEVNLDDAESTLRNINYHFTQRYKFGKFEQIPDTTSETGFMRLRERTTKTGSFIHSLEYQRNFRLYEDNISAADINFYPNFYIDPNTTLDSTYYRSLSNIFQIMLDENPNRANDFGARAFLKHDWVKYSFNTPNDTIVGNGDTSVISHKDYQYQNVQIGASFLHTVGTGWDWLLRGQYYLFGYKAADLILEGYITRQFQGKQGESMISISGKFAIEEPDHFLKYYESNNYTWYNDFKKTKDIRGSITISNEVIKTLGRFDFSLVSDLVFFNDSAVPVQHHPIVTVFSGKLKKDFKLGILHSNHEIHYQVSSNNNVIRIPDLSYYSSNFLGFTVVKNALTAEIGFDLYYYTKYRALAFSPSSGVFYNQDLREMGNYPYLNLFLNAKIKRTRFYVRWDHAYAGQIKKNYFHVLNYPTRGRIVKVGLSWTFYN
ncbi:putative porin [Bacteroidota bacterium]